MKLEKELSKIPLIQDIDELKRQVDELRPFSQEVQNRIMQKFRLEWNYHSNAIEGNPYTYGETVAFIMHGITAKGKKLKDHLDIKGHDEAILFLLEMVKGDRNFTESYIRGLHKMILKEAYSVDAITPSGDSVKKKIKLGEYKDLPNHVKTATGEMHYYATPEETPIKMGELMEWYNNAFTNEEIHPFVLAALFHHKFVAIHPFDDGNGRLGRILMNFILMKKGFPPVVVKMGKRENYYSVLSQADVGEYLPLIEYLGEDLKRSLEVQLKGAKGEDISEISDLDKEIALLKSSFTEDDKIKILKSNSTILKVWNESICSLINDLNSKCNEFRELFVRKEELLEFKNQQGVKVNVQFSSSKKYEIYNIDSPYKVSRFEYRFILRGFKKVNTPFDIIVFFSVDFKNYKYFINKMESRERVKFEKFYNEKLSNEEKNEFVYDIIKIQLIEQIKRYSKNK